MLGRTTGPVRPSLTVRTFQISTSNIEEPDLGRMTRFRHPHAPAPKVQRVGPVARFGSAAAATMLISVWVVAVHRLRETCVEQALPVSRLRDLFIGFEALAYLRQIQNFLLLKLFDEMPDCFLVFGQYGGRGVLRIFEQIDYR